MTIQRLYALSKMVIWSMLKISTHLQDGFLLLRLNPMVLYHTWSKLQTVEKWEDMWTIFVLDMRTPRSREVTLLTHLIHWFFLMYLTQLWTHLLQVHQLLNNPNLNTLNLDVQLEHVNPLTIMASRNLSRGRCGNWCNSTLTWLCNYLCDVINIAYIFGCIGSFNLFSLFILCTCQLRASEIYCS